MGKVPYFMGIEISWRREQEENIIAHLTQEAYADHLVDSAGLSDATTVASPYRSGHLE